MGEDYEQKGKNKEKEKEKHTPTNSGGIMSRSDKISKDLKEYWKIALSEHRDWRNRASKAFKFYGGDQWEPHVKHTLAQSKKPALTFNKIKPVIRNISGYQRQNRQDLVVKARRGGLSILGEIFTELIKYFYDISLADWKVSQQFLNGIISGKGWLALDIDYTREPINGDLLLQTLNPLMVYEDPFSQRYDLSDAKFLIRTSWINKEEIIKQFPKAKKDIEGLDSLPPGERLGMSYETKDYDEFHDQEVTDIHKHRFLLREYWWKEWVEKKLLVNKTTLDVTETDEPDEKIQKIVDMRAKYGEEVVGLKRILPTLNLTTKVGDIVLQDEEDPFNGISEYPLIRFCSEQVFGDKQRVRGEVDDLIDPQQELNKRRSQALHMLNTTAGSGFIVTEGALDPKEEQRLERMGSSPGIKVRARKGYGLNQGIWRIDPPQLSDGHLKLAELSDQELKEISGARDMLGFAPERKESGIALQLRKQHGLVTTEPIFDNFQWTQRILGETILEFIRKADVLSEEEMLSIVQERHLKHDSEEISRALESRKIGRYQMVTTTRRNTPTQRMLDFEQMIQALREGIPIPMEMIIQASDFPNKEEIIEAIKRQQQVQAPPDVQRPKQSAPSGGATPPSRGV